VASPKRVSPHLAALVLQKLRVFPFVVTLSLVASFSLCWPYVLSAQPGSISPETPGQQSQAPPAVAVSAGSMSGHVYRADTGAPLAGAIVTLTGVRPATPADGIAEVPIAQQSARTGTDGSYKFASLEPGTYYQIAVEHGGYFVRGFFGRDVPVAAGQAVSGIDIRLQPAGAVSGNVHDQDSAPLKGLLVTLLCQRPTGQTENPIPSGNAMTDDQGNFRVYGVAPGNCYVLVRPNPGLGLGMAQFGYHTTYYPDADSLDAAQTVQVKAGAETPDIRFTIVFAPAYTVKVKVTESGLSGENRRYWVLIRPSGENAPRAVELVMGRFPVLAGLDGMAELKGITAGTYRISITRTIATPGSATTGGGPPVAETTVQVTDSDVNVEILIPANR